MYSVIENTITTIFRENIFKNYCHQKVFNYGGKAPISIIQYSDNPLYDKIITKLRIDCSNLGADNFKKTPCPKCNAKAETFENVVFECIHYESARKTLENNMLELSDPIINRSSLLFPTKKERAQNVQTIALSKRNRILK